MRRETRFQQTPNTSPESSKPATQPPPPPPPSAPKSAKSEPKFTSPRKPQKAADSFASSSHSRDTPPSSTFRESAEGQSSSTNHSSQNNQKSQPANPFHTNPVSGLNNTRPCTGCGNTTRACSGLQAATGHSCRFTGITHWCCNTASTKWH